MTFLLKSSLSKSFVMLFVVLSTLGLPLVSNAQPKYEPCKTNLDFIANNQIFSGTTILRKTGDKYQLKFTLEQPDGSTCQPAIYWKIVYLKYFQSPDPNEPSEIPSSSLPVDSGQITSNLNFTKVIDLGTASLETYVYTLYLASDSGFTQDVITKQRIITFTDDPKKASPTPTGTVDKEATGTLDGKVGIKGIQNFDESLGKLFNPLPDNLTSPGQIILRLINIGLMLVGILAVIFIIIGGFLMVSSAGNENRLRQGKQTLIWAITGLILSLLSFSIVAIVQSIIT